MSKLNDWFAGLEDLGLSEQDQKKFEEAKARKAAAVERRRAGKSWGANGGELVHRGYSDLIKAKQWAKQNSAHLSEKYKDEQSKTRRVRVQTKIVEETPIIEDELGYDRYFK